jgi:2,4-diketo-3-deoxy-L-fuconate hydrolase
MKLCRFGRRGEEKPGLIDADGRLRDLSAHIRDLTPAEVTPQALAKLHAIDPASLPLVAGTPRYGVPVNGVGKFIAIGLNYSDHAKESGLPLPPEPVFFTKAISCLNGPNDHVMIPQGSVKTDWEVELGVVIGKTCRYVEESQALSHVAGYVLVNDVSEREYQKERGSQWDKGKGCDTFGPVGPWLVTTDEIPDPQTLDMFLDVNGKRMQTGNTDKMVFNVATCVAYVSRFITLYPGD